MFMTPFVCELNFVSFRSDFKLNSLSVHVTSIV